MPTLQTILHIAVRAILVTFAITAIQTVRAIRALRTIQPADVIEESRAVLTVRVIPAMRAVGAVLAIWTMQAIAVARSTRTILMVGVIPAIQALAAAIASRMTQTTQATRTILTIRVMPAMRSIATILALRMVHTTRAIRTILVTRMVPAMRAITVVLRVRMTQTARAIRTILTVRVIPAIQALSAIFAVRMMQAIRTIRTIPVNRLIQAMRASQMAVAGRLIQAPQAARRILVRVTPAIQAIWSTQASRMVQAIRAIPTIRAVQYAFNGSRAVRAGVLAVLVGAAAAYAMPERRALPPLAMSTVMKSPPAPSLPPVTTGMTVGDFNVRFGSALVAPPARMPAKSSAATAPDPVPLQSNNPEPAETQPAALAPTQLAALPAGPLPEEPPRSVEVQLPMPKPPLSPAQRLDLHGNEYDKAEKCLAQAVYFEARNEPARGQQAVAQVVLNRVFSPYYPKDVCSVVYQNAHRHLACQFTFACDGKPDRIKERSAWARANRIAVETLNARVWLSDVNKSTHYHATYLRPYWIRDMKTMARYGLHVFYRPRNWGDGSDEAHWDTPSNSVKPAVVASKRGTATARPAKHVSHRRVYRRHSRA
jgi:hypothetical protein